MVVKVTLAIDGASAEFPEAVLAQCQFVKNFVDTFYDDGVPDAVTVPLLSSAVPRALPYIHRHLLRGRCEAARLLREDAGLFGDVMITAAGLEYTAMVREWTIVFRDKYQFLESKALCEVMERL